MLSSLPGSPPPRSRSSLTDPQDHPYRTIAGAEAVTADGRSLPLVSAMLRGTAQGGIARLVLEQRFENHHAETLHVTYRMPLPADGAVSGYVFVIGDRAISGRVERRRDARERFERAIAAGHTAALLEQERADVFTQSIGNLPARAALVARIAIDQRLAWLPEGEWELRFPTVIGPRYVAAGDRRDDVRGARVITAPGGVAARIRIAIDILDAITAGRNPTSPSHTLTATAGAVEIGDPRGARLDRDIVVRWPVAGPATGVSLAVTRAAGSDDCYGLVTITPPVAAGGDRVLPRDLIVLVDTSGSMSGPPLDKAKQVIALLIESLDAADRLELITFSSHARRYGPAPVPATRSEKQAAIQWLRRLSAGGGTEMRSAVIEALRPLQPGAQRQVVLATDGYVGGEAAIVRQIHAGLPASCRLHFVGVGSSVNRSLAAAMARAGRGTEVICDPGDDAERAARRLIDRTRSPVLTDIVLEGSAVIARAPDAVPDVLAASPVVAAVKLRAGELVVRGRARGGDWERRLQVGMPRHGDGNPAIAALFGRERVADLEARGFAGDDHDAEIEQTGLAFQIATRLTPFVAVDHGRVVQPAVQHEAVPQELPYGTTAAAFGLRSADGSREPRFKGTAVGLSIERYETLLEHDAGEDSELDAFVETARSNVRTMAGVAYERALGERRSMAGSDAATVMKQAGPPTGEKTVLAKPSDPQGSYPPTRENRVLSKAGTVAPDSSARGKTVLWKSSGTEAPAPPTRETTVMASGLPAVPTLRRPDPVAAPGAQLSIPAASTRAPIEPERELGSEDTLKMPAARGERSIFAWLVAVVVILALLAGLAWWLVP